jgi:hypothetical protein
MQAFVCERLGQNVHYLSPLRINERVIKGYDVPDNHEKLVSLKPEERQAARKRLQNDLRYNAGMYVYSVMKKVGENGCVMAAHQFG